MKLAPLLALPLLACSPWRSDARLWAPHDAELRGWVTAHAVSVSDDAGTLAVGPLCDALGEAPVVALGEASHGVHELKAAELAIVRCLAERPGPLTVLFELSYEWVHELDAYVQGDAPAPALAGRNLVENREFADFLAYVREHNARVGPAARVRLGGFDLSCWNRCTAAVVKYLGTVDPARAVEAEARLAPVRAPWSEIEADRGARARAALEHERTRLLANRARFEHAGGPAAFADAVHRLDLALAYASNLLDRYPYDISRDRVMADSVEWFRGALRPGERVVLIAHSGHVAAAPQRLPNGRPAPPSMGEHLRHRLGADYVPVHMTFQSGSFLAHRAGRLADDDAGYGNPLAVYPALAAPRGTLEELLAGSRGATFLDLRRLPAGGPVATYFFGEQHARLLGGVWRRNFARWPLQSLGWARLVPAQAYDIVLLLPEATPLLPL